MSSGVGLEVFGLLPEQLGQLLDSLARGGRDGGNVGAEFLPDVGEGGAVEAGKAANASGVAVGADTIAMGVIVGLGVGVTAGVAVGGSAAVTCWDRAHPSQVLWVTLYSQTPTLWGAPVASDVKRATTEVGAMFGMSGVPSGIAFVWP